MPLEDALRFFIDLQAFETQIRDGVAISVLTDRAFPFSG
jgi:hypothetical protein